MSDPQEKPGGEAQETHDPQPEGIYTSDNEENKNQNDDDIDPWTGFLIAIRNEKLDTFKELLNKHPTNATRIEVATRQPAIFAIAQCSDEDIILEMLKTMAEKGADLAFKDTLKQNIMFYAAKDGKVRTVEYLFSQGVPVNISDSYQQNPLFYAARDGRTEMCQKLIQLGLEPNQPDLNNQTCIFYAAKTGQLETCKFLIEHGARHDYTDNKHQTPLYWARKSNNHALIEYFQSFKNTKKSEKAQPKKEHPPAPQATTQQQAPVQQTKAHPQPQPVQQQPQPQIAAPVVSQPSLTHSISNDSKNAKRRRDKEEPKHPYRIFYSDEHGHKHEMTYADFEKFKKENPKIAELLLNPDKIQSVEAEQREKESWERIANKIIQTLWKMKGCYHFHLPVDPMKLNCLDYFDIVKQPMDFGTIKIIEST